MLASRAAEKHRRPCVVDWGLRYWRAGEADKNALLAGECCGEHAGNFWVPSCCYFRSFPHSSMLMYR
jgi:hypothetical protein